MGRIVVGGSAAALAGLSLVGPPSSSAVSAEHAQKVVADKSAANRRIARRDARRRLRLFTLIPGATPRAERPAGIGGRLRGQGPIPGDSRQVHLLGFLIVRESPRAVFRWLGRHPPRGSDAQENQNGFIYWDRGPRGTLGATAVVRAAPRAGGGCVVRVDIYESWELPRSPAERVPLGSRYLRLIVSEGEGGLHRLGEMPLPTRRVGTSDQRLIDDLVHIANRQPAFQLFRPPSCGPEVFGKTHDVEFVFKAARHGRVLARISQETPIGLCDALILRLEDERPYALEGGGNLLRRAHRLISQAMPRRSAVSRDLLRGRGA